MSPSRTFELISPEPVTPGPVASSYAAGFRYGGQPLAALLEDASRMIRRLGAPEARAAAAADALIIDIRSEDACERDGVIPGSLHIPRTVLEWRVAVDSPWRSPYVGGLDQELILICDHGYSSILAARTLVTLGFRRAGDVIGGFDGWKRARLPVARYQRRPLSADELPGSGPPQREL